MYETTIKKHHLSALTEYLEKVNKKALKLSQPPMSVKVVREHTRTSQNHLGLDVTQYLLDIELHGVEPRVQGWGLAGVLEFTEGGTLVRGVPGIELPARFRQATDNCDHCGTNRRRNKVIVLRNLTGGEFKQVGSTCVADFLGMKTVDSYLSWLDVVARVAADMEDLDDERGCWGGYVEHGFAIDEFVGAASIIIRRFGWVPKSQAFNEGDATSQLTWELLRESSGPSERAFKERWIKENKLYVEDRDNQRAAAAIEWIKSVEVDNDYLHNLQVIVRKGHVIYREAGFAASLLSAYNRAMDWADEKKREAKLDSQYIGESGTRYRFDDITVKAMKSFTGQYGVKTMVRLEDAKGNVLVWWASGEPEWLEVGDTVTVAGTIKKHDEYRGTKQTLINRVSQNLPKKLKAVPCLP